MSSVRHTARVVGIWAVMLCCAFAQQPTIPDHIAQNEGKPVFLPVVRDAAPVELAKLGAADLVVYGKLLRQKAYMNKRQTDIYTDYEMVVQRVVIDRLGIMSAAKRPGGPPRPVVTMYGGELVVNGTKVVLDDLSRTGWPESANLLIFLRRTGGTRFELHGGSAGLFEVEPGGKVKSLLSHAEKDKEVGALNFEQLVQLIAPEGKHF